MTQESAAWLRALADSLTLSGAPGPAATRLNTIADELETPPDGRTTPRLIRVRLYRQGDDNPLADTEAEARPDAPGTWRVAGLPGVALALAQTASAFHGTPTMGLDRATLLKSIKGLRTTISRRGGNAVWRVRYQAGKDQFIARVDVVTV